MKQKIVLRILLALSVVIGFSSFFLYLDGSENIISVFRDHKYYYDIFKDSKNRWLVLISLISGFAPVGVLIRAPKVRFKEFLISVFAGLLIFSIFHLGIKEGFIGAGFLIYIINTTLLFSLGVYFLLGLLASGSRITQRLKIFADSSFQTLFIQIGLGLSLFMLINHFLIITGLYYSILTRALFLGLGAMIYLQRKVLGNYEALFTQLTSTLKERNLMSNPRTRITAILLVLSFAYYYFGFQMSFIPYSTARDANHAYMYHPKVISENATRLWSEYNSAPPLWISYIAFWFSLIQPIKSRFRLGPDTFGVHMNFMSAIFVLLFGIGLIVECTQFLIKNLKKTDEEKEWIQQILVWTGRFFIIMRLTSGMGAFLVFIDNKTDLGVMALSLLAMMSGFIILNKLNPTQTIKKQGILPVILASGFLFTIAALAKPTAFFDVVNFGIIMIGMRIGLASALGAGLIVLGLIIVLQIANSGSFFTSDYGMTFITLGVIFMAIDIIKISIRNQRKDKKTYLHVLATWGITFLIALTVLKGPQTLYITVKTGTTEVKNIVQTFLLGNNTSNQNTLESRTHKSRILLAATQLPPQPEITASGTTLITPQGEIQCGTFGFAPSQFESAEELESRIQSEQLTPQQCSLSQVGANSAKELSKNLRKAPGNGYSEDVGRYVGFGQIEFKNPRRKFAFGSNNKCLTRDRSLREACTLFAQASTLDAASLTAIQNELEPNSYGHNLLTCALNTVNMKDNPSGGNYTEEIKAIRSYFQDRAVVVTENSVFMPYKFILPLNVIFNRSLQNRSSHYTDIGFIWIFLVLGLGIAVILGFITRRREITTIALVGIIARGLRWIAAGGIVWYSLSIIVRAILGLLALMTGFWSISKDQIEKSLGGALLGVLIFWCIIQLWMNFMRISSQGSTGPFMRYKQSNGEVYYLDNNLQQQKRIKIGYGQKDVFDLQFGHYNKFITMVKNRKDEDGVVVDGTYLSYFLHNQRNLKGGSSFSRLREIGSDGDLCKTALRIKDQNIKYIVIDPNIASIVVGEGNSSIFQRFFAKLGPNGELIEDGGFTLVSRLWKAGYMKLISTNNIGAKYAFTLSDEQLQPLLKKNTEEELLITRAKLAAFRFFQQGTNLGDFIFQVFNQRMINGEAIGDIADIIGRTIDIQKASNAVALFKNGGGFSPNNIALQEAIKKLTQDEKIVITQYIVLYNMLTSTTQKGQEDYKANTTNMLMQSLNGGSQLIVFEFSDLAK